MKIFKKAFTLAEVLIIIGIIGVVAAITIPTLEKNYQKKITVEKLKKSYAMFHQVIKLAEAEYDDLNGWDYNLSSEDFANKYLLPYMSGVQKAANRISAKSLLGASGRYFNEGIQYILNDGSYMSVRVAPTLQWNLANLSIGVDLNGIKGPNRYGRDIFLWQFQHLKIISLQNL